MPVPSHDLSRLDSNTFEHMVNMLALQVLGAGHTGFGPGSDGGRDGYFEGKAPYPSASDSWSGRWYIQSKFKNNASLGDPQKWLLKQIDSELREFTKHDTKRTWPDIWIIVTNIEPTGVPATGSFDKARKLVSDNNPELAKRFHIWGGRKILDLLALNPTIAEYYAEFVTPGQVLTKLYEQFGDAQAGIEHIVRYLVVGKLIEEQFTKLEQAGSTVDNRPGIQRLFTDLPFICAKSNGGMAAIELARTAAQNHRIKTTSEEEGEKWQPWRNEPSRSRVWFIRGGPGQGKSTLTQYISQVQRAALILTPQGPVVTPAQRAIASEVKKFAEAGGLWPIAPRIPVTIELKEYAQWYGRRAKDQTKRFLAFFSETLTSALAQKVHTGTLTRAFRSTRWLFIFDGLDEVPGDSKDKIASEITYFVEDTLVGSNSDSLIVCTSRPQGYAGQFDSLGGATVILAHLSKKQALSCARPVLEIDRSAAEAKRYLEILSDAIQSPAVAEIMTTPLQSHIMAVVVRDGGRPPDRKWDLFSNFYKTIKRREANRYLADKRIATLLREEDKLIKSLHNRLGFVLHARAETSAGAVTSLNREELSHIIKDVVSQLKESEVDETVALLMEATIERLVLVNTPDASTEVRFDIRPLQEFFAAEFLYEAGQIPKLDGRLHSIAADSHWREVMHFLFSGLVENERPELAGAIDILIGENNGNDELGHRPLHRRLAIGGLITARLLQEGVLEQDKRVRSQFRECLAPLLACTDGISQLGKITASQTRLWLSDVLIDTMFEQSEAESIGAAIAAPRVIVDDHPRIFALENFLLNASSGYVACFLRHVAWTNLESDEYRPPRWLIKLLLRISFRSQWFDLESRTHSEARMILRRGAKHVTLVALELGYPKSFADALPKILGIVSSSEPPQKTDEHRLQIAGIFDLTYRVPPGVRSWESWGDEIWKTLERSEGLLKAIYLAVRFIRSKSQGDGESLLGLCKKNVGCLSVLPPYVASYYSDAVVDRWGTTPTCEWSELLQKDRPGWERYLEFFDSPAPQASPPQWSELVENWPDITWHILFGHPVGADWLESFGSFVRTSQGLESLQKSIGRHPTLWISAIATWGSYLPIWDKEGKIQASLHECAARVPSFAGVYFTPNKLDLITPKLPSEARFLPSMTWAIVQSLRYRFKEEKGKELSVTQRFGERVQKIVPDPTQLRKLSLDDTNSTEIRAAAIVLWLLHPNREAGEPLPTPTQLAELYEPERDTWYVQALAIALNDLVHERNPTAISSISMLIEASRNDYPTRGAFDSVIAHWREMARAPVHSGGLPALWKELQTTSSD